MASAALPSASTIANGDSPALGRAAIPEHCYYCFEVILYLLTRAGRDISEVPIPFSEQQVKYPLFVTWNIYPTSRTSSSSDAPGVVAVKQLTGSNKVGDFTSSPRLRGCIGNFAGREPLPMMLRDYAKIAAFEDERFDPIAKDELGRLECGVSLLTNFEDCSDYLDWTPGQHGIYIFLTPPASSRTLTATYLPEVTPEQGWTRVQAVDSAIRKAGWSGRIDEELRKSLRVRRYGSEKVKVNVLEWLQWRQSQT